MDFHPSIRVISWSPPPTRHSPTAASTTDLYFRRTSGTRKFSLHKSNSRNKPNGAAMGPTIWYFPSGPPYPGLVRLHSQARVAWMLMIHQYARIFLIQNKETGPRGLFRMPFWCWRWQQYSKSGLSSTNMGSYTHTYYQSEMTSRMIVTPNWILEGLMENIWYPLLTSLLTNISLHRPMVLGWSHHNHWDIRHYFGQHHHWSTIYSGRRYYLQPMFRPGLIWRYQVGVSVYGLFTSTPDAVSIFQKLKLNQRSLFQLHWSQLRPPHHTVTFTG